MRTKAIIAALKKRQDAIAKERDRLLDLECEITSLKESCNEAWYALQSAIDHLSELV